MTLDILIGSMLDCMRDNDEFEELVSDLARVQIHLNDPVRLLIMGEFSVGKSTLINTLLKENIVDSGLVPITAMSTYLRYSEEAYCEVVSDNGVIERYELDQLKGLTSERVKSSKEKSLNIHHINLYSPNPILKDIVLIDTPGLNSGNKNHAEQAYKAYEEADDSLWIFKYGAVGRSTEFQILKKLVDDGLQPIGIINMMDESNDDNIDDYLQYEAEKLGGRVRNLIGVSAKEAKEAYEENDQELLELSGFPELVSIMENVKNDSNRKTIRFERRFLKIYANLIVAINQFLKSESYQNDIMMMDKILVDIRQVNECYFQYISKEEQDIQALYERIKEKIEKGIQLNDWTRKQDFKVLVQEIPELIDLEDFNTLFLKLKKDIHKFKKDIDNYTKKLSEVFGEKVGFWKLLFVDNEEIKNLRLLQKELINRQDDLNKEIKSTNKIQLNLMKRKDHLVSCIEEYYWSFIQRESSDKTLRIKARKEEVLQENFNALKIIEEFTGHYSYLDNLQSLINQVPNLINSRLEDKLNIRTLPHSVREVKMMRENKEFTNKVHTQNDSVALKNFDINVRLELPEHIEQLDIAPNYFLHNINPMVNMAAIATVIMGIFIIGQFDSDSDAYESRDSMDSYVENYATTENVPVPESTPTDYIDSNEYEVLTPAMVNDQEVIGTIETADHNVTLYEKSDYEYKETYYISEPYTTWDVYSESENYYEIQENYWVPKEDVVSFTPLLQEYIQSEMDGIATISLNSEEAYVFERANEESEKVGLLGDEKYQVIAFTETGWIQIGDNAWVKYDESVLLDQQELEDKLSVDNMYDSQILRTEETTSPFIPVFSYDTRESSVIGYLKDTSSVDIVELPNSEWARIGNNAWMEAEKYLDINWDFVPEEDVMPIGSLIVETDVLNVRQMDQQNSNLLGILEKESEVNVYGISNSTGWYRIGKEGWVSVDPEYSTFIGQYDTRPTDEPIIGEAVVTVDMINVRDTEYSDSNKIAVLNQNAIIDVYEISAETGWYRIGKDAWISNDSNLVSYEAHELEELSE